MLLATCGCTFKKLIWVQIDQAAMTITMQAGTISGAAVSGARHTGWPARWCCSPRTSLSAAADHPRWRCADVPDPVIPTIDSGVDEDAAKIIAQLKSRERWLVGVGRLVEQKGFDLLLPAFASLANGFQEWGLLILGEGPDRQSLERQAPELRIADRVLMPGVLKKLHKTLQHCDIFVLSSRYEGQPLALMEAMLCGLPVVASIARRGRTPSSGRASTACWSVPSRQRRCRRNCRK